MFSTGSARRRSAFLVDAGIHGFAVGAGFAVVENVYYILALPTASIVVWLVRGFGTAIMHGGVTAMFAVVSKNLIDRNPDSPWLRILPGFVVAVVIHSLYNHLFLKPILSAVLVLVVVPAAMMVVFSQSERVLRKWLGVGFRHGSGALQPRDVGEHLRDPCRLVRPVTPVDLRA